MRSVCVRVCARACMLGGGGLRGGKTQNVRASFRRKREGRMEGEWWMGVWCVHMCFFFVVFFWGGNQGASRRVEGRVSGGKGKVGGREKDRWLLICVCVCVGGGKAGEGTQTTTRRQSQVWMSVTRIPQPSVKPV